MPKDQPAGLALRARAKVNLYLHVTGRRDDGYHELDSLMVFPEVGDELTLSPARGISLEVAGPFGRFLGNDPSKNLIQRAAEGLRALADGGTDLGAHIRLQKNLPVAAGLGGGSADAAAALKGLLQLWDLEVPAEALQALAIELGADVPPCLESRSVFASGIGEILTPAEGLPAFWLLLVNPRLPVPTAKVFKARAGGFSEPAAWRDPPRDFEDFLGRLEVRHNDLEVPARAVESRIDGVLEAIVRLPGCRLARMSGSGATCFGLFTGAAEAEAAAAGLRAAQPAWWVAAAAV